MKTVEYHFRSVLKSSEKGDIQLVVGDDDRLYVRRYRNISQELFRRLQGVSNPFLERMTERSSDEIGAYFISEYIEGTPACDCTFTEKEAVRALLELCSAVSALHKVGIIHRDIKPGNIIRGNDSHIRLIDFDSARLEKTYQRHDTEMLGTAGFAPPEQYGFMQTNRRSDIYSFGVTMEEILGENADKPKYRRIINRCTQFDPKKRYSDIMSVSRAIKRSTHPNYALFAAAGAIIVAGIILSLRKEPPTAPQGIEMLSETTESSAAVESADTTETEVTTESEAETETTAAPTEELSPTEVSREQTTEAHEFSTSEQAEAIPEITDPAEEETAEAALPAVQTDETTTEYTPATIETSESECTPNILSDSVNPNRITFETVQGDDGLYTDVFDYVFYDDPAVCGEWQLCGILAPDTDFEAITAEELVFFGSFEDFTWQYLTISADGSYVLRDAEKFVILRSQWTNGYSVFFDGGCSFVRRMFEVTVNGVEYLMFEQKPTNNYPQEIPHRFLVYSRTN